MTPTSLHTETDPTPAAPDDLGGPIPRFVDATAGRAAAVVFGSLSALRHRRIFHPYGDAFGATLDVTGRETRPFGAPLLDEAGRRRCVVRISRGIGLPEPLPDFLGLAIRILDAHGPDQPQDLLLVTSAEVPIFRTALLPTSSYTARRYSSILPYRVGNTELLFGARALTSEPPERARHLDELAALLAGGRVRFALEAATSTGPWEDIATLEVGRKLTAAESESLRYDPYNAGDNIRPAGVVNALRRRAYRASQQARPTPVGEQR
ncbi:MAG: hypothetical protein JWM47_1761 [Acidimicrobiales bacterium]|nr:hypothetical protein [Acidimicrobiales bacterium]